jgi:taurine dioxygenase
MSTQTVARVGTGTLMSGVGIEDLGLPGQMAVSPTGGSCGAIVGGVDLADDLPGEVIGGLLALLDHAGLVILPDQHRLTPERQGVVTEWFGRPFSRDSGVDNMTMVDRTPVQILGSQAHDEGEVPAADVDDGRELFPHSDVQDYQLTPDYTILHAVEVVPSEVGGNTYWANLYQAYDELDDETKELVDGLRWMPASTQATAYGVGMQSAKASVARDGLRLESDVRHPVVRTHPVTRRKALWVSTSFTVRVEGVGSEAEGKALAKRLKDYANSDRFWYRHQWSAHDVVMWDNRCVNHRREGWPAGMRRTMHRSQAGSARPF